AARRVMREAGNVIEVAVRDGGRRIADDVVRRAPELEQRPETGELVEGFVARDRDALYGNARRLDADAPAAVGIGLPHGRRLFQTRGLGQKSSANAASTSAHASTADIERNIRSLITRPPSEHS